MLLLLLLLLQLNYDMTVRESDGSVIQFQYGEDSLDVTKCQYLKPEQMKYLADNLGVAHRPADVALARQVTDVKGVKKARKNVKKWKKAHKGEGRERASPFLSFCDQYKAGVAGVQGYDLRTLGQAGDGMRVSRATSSLALLDTYRAAKETPEVAVLEQSTAPCPDPVVATYPQGSHLNSLTERMDAMIEDYIATRGETFPADQFREMVQVKSQLATVDPGEPVGILAAQSVGEPSTQMTLNTFHFAGRGEMNVTLGIPRLREILMVASANIKTPSMDIPFREGVTEKEQDRLRIRLNRVLLTDLLERVEVVEKIRLVPTRARTVALKFHFLPYKHYKQNFGVKPAEVLHYFEHKFINKVFLPVLAAVTKEKKVGVESASETEGKNRGGGEEGGDDEDRAMEAAAEFGMGEDSDDEFEEGEGTDVAKKMKRQGDAEYEELDDEEIEQNQQLDKDHGGDEYIEEEEDSKENILNATTEHDEGLGEEMEVDDPLAPSVAETGEEMMRSGEPARRRATVLRLVTKGGVASLEDYSYDTEHQTWCCLTLAFPVERKRVDLANVLRQAAAKGVIHEVKNIKRAFVMEDDKNRKMLKTDGINIQAMFQYEQLLNISGLGCNNIHDMANFYGIEAANKTIVSEITGVFRVYGITVDPRHLSLIADFMTFDGVYKPFNRVGMENNSSPLQQMTFETAMGFLRSATLGGKTDTLDSPSACVVLGKPVKGGTGAFSLLQKLS